MKQFVSVWDMRKAFTLIEVMVAVVIVSVVIMALLQMRGNSTHMFLNIGTKSKISQYSSFLISNSVYGFENKIVSLDKLLDDFELENDLRRRVKQSRVELIYQKLETLDMSENNSNDAEETVNSNIAFEIGKTILKTDTSSTGLFRLRVQ